jgi:hypothetical protein
MSPLSRHLRSLPLRLRAVLRLFGPALRRLISSVRISRGDLPARFQPVAPPSARRPLVFEPFTAPRWRHGRR